MQQELTEIARKNIGAQIKLLMTKKNIKIAQVARDAGLTREQIYFIRDGSRSYTIDTLLKALNAMELYLEIKEK